MIRNYVTIALRNLWNKRLYSGINMLGLSIAAAFCMLVYMYMQQENSYDTFHKNGDRLYRLEATSLFEFGDGAKPKKGFFSFLMDADHATRNMLSHPFVLADDIKNSLPEVEAVVRSQGNGNSVFWYNGQSFKMGEDKVVYIESNFFTVFDFPLKQGNAAQVLKKPENIVINERTAQRFFGNADPVGKTISLAAENGKNFTVAGVSKNFPSNSSYDYDIVMPLEAHPSHLESIADRSNNHFNYATILLLKKNIDRAAFEKKLTAFSKSYFAATVKEWAEQEPDKKAIDFQLYIRAFTKAHLNTAYPWGHYTNLENLYELAALALIILIIACVNYVLLTLTNTVSRSQEVGIRKTMGAGRKHIVWQFLTETQLLVSLSIIVGLFICITAIPLFNSITGATLDLSVFSIKDFVLASAVLFLVLSITAGFYPAFLMSGMKPLNMLRKFSSVRINPLLSKGLVVVQYAACVLLIISAIVISRQLKYMNLMQLGFDKEQVMVVANPYDYEDPLRKEFAVRLSQYVLSEPSISKVAFSNSKFGRIANLNGHLINDKREMIFQLPIDFNYFDIMNIPLLKGRYFSKDMPTDSARFEIPDKLKMEGSSSVRRAIVINETLYNLLGKPPLDEINRSMGARIIGVCKDYHFFNSTQKIAPAYHMIGGMYGFQYAYLKIKPGQEISSVVNKVKVNVDRITANHPFEYTFMDEDVKRGYEAYTKWLKTINAATLLAVLIACMGLFGLSALYAISKTKEVGIRKVMGATVTSIFLLLNKDVLKLALISFVIAVPLSLYFMNSWLQNFAFRITLGWELFMMAGVIGLALAILVVSFHSVKAAKSNPVKSLRSE
ncbi:MAG: ABC transporter permease [Chitinophagaceae bacterium]